MKKQHNTVNDEGLMYLMPKKKRGFLRIFFSRAGIAFLLLIFQMGFMYALYDYCRDYYEWFSAVFGIFSILAVIWLFSSDMDSTARLTWLLIISIVPIPGALLLLFTKEEIGHRAVKIRVSEVIAQTKNKLQQNPDILGKPENIESGTTALHEYLNKSGCFPLYENTQATFFSLGEKKFDSMISELEKAEKFIFIEYFIIAEGYMWGKILNILARKAQEGVDIRVIYDGMCEISLLSSDYPQRLEKLGIQCKPFSPIRPFLSTHYNYRDHRKILVIDGKTAFTGGINLSDEYINRNSQFGHWKDTAVMLKGEAVQSFTLMFLQMWNLTEDEPIWDKYVHCIENKKSDGFIMPYCDCPLDSFKAGEFVYIDIINKAKTYVHIMTPYLILDNELESALKFAALRGVDVKIILPGIPDKKLTYSLTKSYYKYLESAGVKIYEYTPGFVHAKILVSDDEKAVVGTINLDYRSLYHHFECAVYMFKSSCIGDIETDFLQTIAKCHKVTLDTIKNEHFFYKIMGGIMRLFAPLF